MSGSEFERGTIVTEALSANSVTDSAKREPAREHAQYEHTWRPPAEGLYDLSQEKDACGVSFIANIKGVKSHKIVGKLRDEHHNLVHSEKFLEMAFDKNGHLLRTENQFAEGVPSAVKARLAATEAAGKQAKN